MTPERKRTWKGRALTATALISAVVVVAGAISPIIRPVARAAIVSTVEPEFVHQRLYDSVRIVQQGTRALDSLSHDQEIREINARLAGIDSGVRCLRHPKRGYCQ
jgi:hypothetical protein